MGQNENDHYAVIELYKRKLRLSYEGKIVAESSRAMILKEVFKKPLNPVFYIPKEDILVPLEMEPETKGFCPIKGHANRWHLKENPTEFYFAWSYEDPIQEANAIKGRLAFNMTYVTLISEPLPS